MTDAPAGVPEVAVGSGEPSRGWHPDPEDPKRERWHDGFAFTRHTHRALRRASPLGAEFDRGSWAGANSAARTAQLIGNVSAVIFLLIVLAVALNLFGLLPLSALDVALWLLAAAAAAQAACGIQALRRASHDGALVLAITVITQGSIVFMATISVLVVLNAAWHAN